MTDIERAREAAAVAWKRTQTLKGGSMTDESKITREEMVELFGETMPPEAVSLVWDAPGDWTLGQVRARLREIAAERPTPEPDLQQTPASVEPSTNHSTSVESDVKLIKEVGTATEFIVFRRIITKRLDGYTMETADEIARAVIPIVQEHTVARIMAWLRSLPHGWRHVLAGAIERGEWEKECGPISD